MMLSPLRTSPHVLAQRRSRFSMQAEWRPDKHWERGMRADSAWSSIVNLSDPKAKCRLQSRKRSTAYEAARPLMERVTKEMLT